MRASSVISSLTLLAATVSTAPLVRSRAAQASDPPFQVSKLVIDTVENGNTTIKFNIYDPDPLTNATATCSGSWKADSTDYPKDTYELCGNSTFAWNFDSFDSVEKFTLGLEHQFTDPSASVGDPPYDQVTNFAHAPVNTTYISCDGVGNVSCKQTKAVSAPIYATVAKR
ncbi:hypothetical protein M409DRAFT_61462 [Zasmidium cellare ATCC 36951]|uniref:AA1-like domain-containing protein n=1 Tax=Zasmidium cellare ATCC 36951 TaxID=1080233 RepID=A0A6A6BV95_ZASCE|nr:uncharacterized protein M409DRAFT_61462 [Zasmidium cellare ATCC 36951]KAF2158681.1 hypothetical protein M409DRAFT_61462 [Zasmidium cellare ATCC 36951]